MFPQASALCIAGIGKDCCAISPLRNTADDSGVQDLGDCGTYHYRSGKVEMNLKLNRENCDFISVVSLCIATFQPRPPPPVKSSLDFLMPNLYKIQNGILHAVSLQTITPYHLSIIRLLTC